MTDFLNSYSRFVVDHRWIVVLASLLVMVALAAGGRHLTTTSDHRSLFDEDSSDLKALEALEERFAVTDSILIAVAPKEGSAISIPVLIAVEELTESGWQIPHSVRVDSLTNYIHSRSSEDELIVAPLVEDAQSLSETDLKRIEDVVSDPRELPGYLISRDQRVSGLAITFALPDSSEESNAAVIEITDHVQDLVDEARKRHPEIRYFVTGPVAISRVYAQVSEEELQRLIPIMIPLILFLAAVLLRSILGTMAIFITVTFVIAAGMGFAGWIGTVLNPSNIVVPIIVMTVAIAHTIHVVSSSFLGMKRGLDNRAAIEESLRINMRPLLISSLTTAIGFLSLNVSEVQPFRTIGNLVAFSMLLTFIYSVSFLPALLAILKLRPSRSSWLDRFDLAGRLGDFVVARSSSMMVVVMAVAIVAGFGATQLEITDTLTKYMDERYQFRRDTDFVTNNLTSPEQIQYTVESGREHGITDVQYLEALDSFADWYRQQPQVERVVVFSDVMKRLNKNMNDDDPDYYRVPESSDLASQFLLLYELSLPWGRDLNEQIDVNKSATRMTVQFKGNPTSAEQRNLAARAKAWVSENQPQLEVSATGLSLAVAYLSEKNTKSMINGTAIAIVLISIILLLVLRSGSLGVISLVPNLVPLLMTFGLWGYFVEDLNLAGAMTGIIAFGIIVDDTVHFMLKYELARSRGSSPGDAVRQTFSTVGPALVTTTIVLCAGFLVLTFSGFLTTWTAGLMVSLAVFLALMSDLLLLPAMLIKFDRREVKAG